MLVILHTHWYLLTNNIYNKTVKTNEKDLNFNKINTYVMYVMI